MPGSTGSMGILVVDDEGPVRNLVASILKQHGYAVTEASGGAEALRILDRNQDAPALLLTDIRMPEMDGIELARLAARTRPGINIMYMTGFSAQRPAPGSAVLMKPFTAKCLLDQVNRALTPRESGGTKAPDA